MGQISRNSRGAHNIVAGQLVDMGGEFAQKGEGLANSSCCSKNGNFGFEMSRRVKRPSGADYCSSETREHIFNLVIGFILSFR